MNDSNKLRKCQKINSKRRAIIVILAIIAIIIIGNGFIKQLDRRSVVIEMSNPIIVEFPLRGEWKAMNSPGDKVPSHGTNKLATRYAYDFIQVDWNRSGKPAYQGSFFDYLIHGKSLDKYYAYGKVFHSPFDGTVVAAENGYFENAKTNLFSDIANAYKHANYFDPNQDDVRSIAGNYVVIKYSDNIYAALCHLKTNFVMVSVGQKVKKGEPVGKVGYSGNSMAPHLHFQLMDSSDIRSTNGLAAAFEKYELFQGKKWQPVTRAVPRSRDRIRF